jgi:DNA-directed RNA polymerase subunit L
MQLHLIERTNKSIKVGLGDCDTTLVTPLLDKLDDDSDVKIVRYIDTHPELNEPALYVETIEGKPEDAIKRATDAISEYFSAVQKS